MILMKKFSITYVIFTYNSSDLIHRTLDALRCAIEYHKIKNQVLLVDNNSSDDTLNIVKNFITENNFSLKIIVNKKPGLIYSRVKAIDFVTSDFVCFIDDDNFIHKNWNEVLEKVIIKYNPDVIGCSTVGISKTKFPKWWKKFKLVYACGKRYKKSKFINNRLDKFWGAGLTCRANMLRVILKKMDFFCTGRMGEKLLSGEDVEINYRLRLLGATFFNCNELIIDHFIREKRLKKDFLKKTILGNLKSAVLLDSYRYILTKKIIYRIDVMVILGFFYCIIKSIENKQNLMSVSLDRLFHYKINKRNVRLIKKFF